MNATTILTIISITVLILRTAKQIPIVLAELLSDCRHVLAALHELSTFSQKRRR
jgi:hypothetical protein